MKPSSPIVPLSRTETTTATQVNTLLQILQTTVMPISNFQLPDGWKGTPELDGGVKAAMETTAVKVCDRLNEIIEDSKRWGSGDFEAIEKSVSEYYQAAAELTTAQAELQKEVQTPHFRYRPVLIRLEHDIWVAVVGSTIRGLVGIGATPAEAIQSFDQVFTGEIPPPIMAWLEAHEAAIRAGIASPPFPNEDEEQTTKNVDAGGGSQPQGDETTGNPSPGNSNSNGSVDEIGGKENRKFNFPPGTDGQQN